MSCHQQAAKCRTAYRALLLAAVPAGIIAGLWVYWSVQDLYTARMLGGLLGILTGAAVAWFGLVFHRGSVLYAGGEDL